MLIKSKIKKLPDRPGVYFFKRNREILYIGKATSLRDRVRSYFSPLTIEASRGVRIVQMLALATRVDYRTTDSVLEALILESELIKKYQPKYNAKAKDDKSYLYVVITREDFPRVLMVRGKDLKTNEAKEAIEANEAIFGPFPNPSELRAALKIVRKIFPFRNVCKPKSGKPCFNYQLGLCPGVCLFAPNKIDYRKNINQIKLLFQGRKKVLIRKLTKSMRAAARAGDFEQAVANRDKVFALKHIQDISLIKTPISMSRTVLDRRGARIEAYDVAHLAGSEAVGVMVVAENGELKKGDYRKFKVTHGADDLDNLREVLARRLTHLEWPRPGLVVIDGGLNQLNTAQNILVKEKFAIPVVSVVKDERHQPREIIGDQKLATTHRLLILRLNHEAHRFAINYHRQRQRKIV